LRAQPRAFGLVSGGRYSGGAGLRAERGHPCCHRLQLLASWTAACPLARCRAEPSFLHSAREALLAAPQAASSFAEFLPVGTKLADVLEPEPAVPL